MIGKTVSHYKILEKVGGGGMGVVYKARDLKLDRTVALKFLPPQLGADEKEKKRFIREAKLVSSLDHPNICTVHEIDETKEDQIFIVMACYEGETLKEKIEHGPLPVEEALELVQQAARGLAKAHGQGIVHRDLKPANIFITGDGVVKILDFGLAKLAGQTRLTKTGSTMGTVAYMSPEQSRGEDVDQRTDIWSLGVVLHEMVTGKVPFRGEYEQAVIYSILNEEPKGMGDIPESLRPVIQKSLEKNKENRYPDVKSMLDDLSGKKRPGKKPRVLKKKGLAKPRRLSVVVLGIVGFILLGLVMALGVRKIFSRGPLKKFVIAVMPFENRLDPEDKDYTCRRIQDMVIRILGESNHINVISNVRLMSVFKEMKTEASAAWDESLSMDLAKTLGANRFIKGSLALLGSKTILSSDIIETKSGRLIRSQSQENGIDESVMVDSLCRKIKEGLGLTKKALEQKVRPIDELMTSNAEAYELYLRGLDSFLQGNSRKADEFYKQAIGLDSTFARAYLEYFRSTGDVSMLEKALKYIGQTTRLDSLTILQAEAAWWGKFKEHLRLTKEIIREFPREFEGYALMGTYLSQNHKFKEAIPYDKKFLKFSNYRGEGFEIVYNYRKTGQLDSANHYLKLWNEKYPNHDGIYLYESRNYLRLGDIEKAVSKAKKMSRASWINDQLQRVYWLADKPDSAIAACTALKERRRRFNVVTFIANIHIYQGKYSQALDSLKTMDLEKPPLGPLQKYEFERTLFDLQGNRREADEIWSRSREDYKSYFNMLHRVGKKEHDTYMADSIAMLLIPEAYYTRDFTRALRLCDDLESQLQNKELPYGLGWGHYVLLWDWRGNIFYQTGYYQNSIRSYEMIIKEEPSVFHQYRVADCLFRLKQYKRARSILLQVDKTSLIDSEWYLRTVDFSPLVQFGYSYPRTFYLLGRINEELGKPKEAAQAFRKLLEIWREADQDIPELVNAKMRLKKLEWMIG